MVYGEANKLENDVKLAISTMAICSAILISPAPAQTTRDVTLAQAIDCHGHYAAIVTHAPSGLQQSPAMATMKAAKDRWHKAAKARNLLTEEGLSANLERATKRSAEYVLTAFAATGTPGKSEAQQAMKEQNDLCDQLAKQL